jgi:hypothetical protein
VARLDVVVGNAVVQTQGLTHVLDKHFALSYIPSLTVLVWISKTSQIVHNGHF